MLPLVGWHFPDGAPEQGWRNYTVRRHDRETGEIEVDVVLHEPRGPACTWGGRAPLGADVDYAGPRVDFRPRRSGSQCAEMGRHGPQSPAISSRLRRGGS